MIEETKALIAGEVVEGPDIRADECTGLDFAETLKTLNEAGRVPQMIFQEKLEDSLTYRILSCASDLPEPMLDIDVKTVYADSLAETLKQLFMRGWDPSHIFQEQCPRGFLYRIVVVRPLQKLELPAPVPPTPPQLKLVQHKES